MKKIAILAVAIGALTATSAMAQGVGIGVGPGGVGVSVDDGYRGDGYRRDRDWRNTRNEYRDDRRYRRDRDWDRRRDDGDRVYIERY